MADVSKKEVVEQTFKKITETFQHIDIVVNCAGVVCEESLEHTMNVNLVIIARSSSVVGSNSFFTGLTDWPD